MRIKHLLACLALAASFAPAWAQAAEAAGADTVEHHYVLVPNGARIEVLAQGSGRPLVLLPSRGRGARDFDRLAEDFAHAGYRVLRPQPRGIGGSVGAMKGVTLHDYADDMAAVIEDVAHQPVVMVGHAFGNWVARATAVDHPELVRGVVIVAAAAKHYPPGLSPLVDRSADLSLPDSERLKAIQSAFFAPGHDARVWLGGWYPAVNESQYLAGKATKQSDWWSGGKAPMLDLQAELDKFKPPATRSEVRDEFGARVTEVVIPGAAHALVPEAPQAVADAIIAWERQLPAQR